MAVIARWLTWECPNGHRFTYPDSGAPKWCPGCGTSTVVAVASVPADDYGGAVEEIDRLKAENARLTQQRDEIDQAFYRWRREHAGAVEALRAWWDAYEAFERTGSMAALNQMGEAARRAALAEGR